MPIPGTRPQREVVAKVRVGEKVMRGGRELPSSTDHFVCEDAEFNSVVGTSAKQILVYLADENESFTSGLEWWQGKLLVCYSKGDKREDTNDYEAYRLPSMQKGGRRVDLLVGARLLTQDVKGKERAIIACPVRDCSYLKAKDCRPKGRLQFYIDGIDRSRGVFQFDTQSWNTIEKIEGTLLSFPDPRGVPFMLTVTMVSNAKSRYPVVSLEPQQATTPLPEPASAEEQKAWAALLVQAAYLIDAEGNLADGRSEAEARATLAILLDHKYPDWRKNERLSTQIVARIKEIGVVQALATMIKEGLS